MSKNKLTELKQKIADKLDFRKFSEKYIGEIKGQHNNSGDTELEFICPFHDESEASLNFNINQGLWHCFGCGKSGDFINLYMELENKEFWEAITELGEWVGINVPEEMPDPSLTLQEYAEAKGLDPKLLKDLGLENGDWYGSDTLRVPYWNTKGELFRTRVRTSLFDVGNGRFKWDDDGEEQTLYGLWKLPECGDKALLVEGESDCHTLWNIWENYPVLGVPGKSNLRKFPDDWIKYLREFKEITILQENDAREEVNQAAATLASETEADIYILDLPTDDVNDLYELDKNNFENSWAEAVKEKRKYEPDQGKPKKKKVPGGRKATYYRMAVDIDPDQLRDTPSFPKKVAKDLPVIDKYVSWIDDNTETPASFAFAAIKNQLGLLLGRKIRTVYGQTDHYPIFYDGLIGKSSFSRKSSTIKAAHRIMQKATSVPGEQKNYIVIPGVGSAEGVLKQIQGSSEVIQGQYPKALLKLDEMSVLTDKLGQSKTQTFISRLNELWDVPPEVTNPTIGNPIELEKPTVSLLAGSTAENLKGAWEERTIEGGFFNRFCWWTSSELKIKPEAKKMPNNVENEIVSNVQNVVDVSNKLASEDHAFVKTEDAQEHFNKWYRGWRKDVAEKDQEDVVIARLPDQVIRHALLFSTLLGKDKITLEAMEKAITMGSYLQKTAYHVLERFTETSMGKLKKRVITVLNENGTVKKSELTQATSGYYEGGVSELNRLLQDLEELEIIETT